MAVNCRVYYSHFLCFRSRFRFSNAARKNRSVLALFHLCQSLNPTNVDWCVVCDIFGASYGIARMLSVCLSFFRHFSKDKRADKWARWSRSVCAAKFQFIHFRWAGHGGHGNWSGCGSRWDGGRGLWSFQLQSSLPQLPMDLEYVVLPSNKCSVQNVATDGDLIFSSIFICWVHCMMDM